ncbi:MAG: hypothetical protein R3B96_22240 [Pirellulaceae bacterium]
MPRPDRLVGDVPPELGSIVERMTAKSVTERFQSMDEVIDSLEKFLSTSTHADAQRGERQQRLAAAGWEIP